MKNQSDEADAGLPLALDINEKSASEDRPAFLVRPKGAPVYFGFKILHDVVVEGFTFGAITDFEAQPSDEGDAFVIAPDGGRAGLVWTVSTKPEFEQVCPPSVERWGVWAVSFPYQMNSRENVRRNLEVILPKLKVRWERWRRQTPPA